MFFPFAFTGVCTGELCRLQDSLPVFDDAGRLDQGLAADPSVSAGFVFRAALRAHLGDVEPEV